MHETKKRNNNNNVIVLYNYETIEVILKVMFLRQNYNTCSTNLVTLSKLFFALFLRMSQRLRALETRRILNMYDPCRY